MLNLWSTLLNVLPKATVKRNVESLEIADGGKKLCHDPFLRVGLWDVGAR